MRAPLDRDRSFREVGWVEGQGDVELGPFYRSDAVAQGYGELNPYFLGLRLRRPGVHQVWHDGGGGDEG